MMLFSSAASPSASPGIVFCLGSAPSTTDELKSAVPVEAGVSAVKPILMLVPVKVTFWPSVTASALSATVAQYSPAPGEGQLFASGVPSIRTSVAERLAYPAGARISILSTPESPGLISGRMS